MLVKQGVELSGVNALLFVAAAYYDLLRLGAGLGQGTITSGTDSGDDVGPARSVSSLHPAGGAVDLRTRDLPRGVPEKLAAELRRLMNGSVIVIVEADHLHVQLALPGVRA